MSAPTVGGFTWTDARLDEPAKYEATTEDGFALQIGIGLIYIPSEQWEWIVTAPAPRHRGSEVIKGRGRNRLRAEAAMMMALSYLRSVNSAKPDPKPDLEPSYPPSYSDMSKKR